MESTFALVSIFIFAGTTLIPWYIERNRQIFHPLKFWSALQVVLVAPAAILVVYYPDFLHKDVFLAGADGASSILIKTLLLYSLLNLFVYLGYYTVNAGAWRRKNFFQAPLGFTPLDSLLIVTSVFVVGLLAFAVKIYISGGIGFIVDNVSRRVELQRGLGPINYLIDGSFGCAVILSLRRLAMQPAARNLIIFGIVLVSSATLMTLFGGRKATMHLVLASLIIYSMYAPTKLLFNIKSILVLVVLYVAAFVYFIAVLNYRNSNDLFALFSITAQSSEEVLSELTNALMSMSYLDTYVFIVSHFNYENMYYGATLYDLSVSLFPSNWMPDKPPVDDGLYVRYAMLGMRVEPGTPARLLTDYGSWPPETLGYAYMNFGAFGIPIAGVILGCVLGLGARYVARTPNSLLGTIVLCQLFLNFEISNLRITNLIVMVIISYFLCLFLNSVATIMSGKSVRKLSAQERAKFQKFPIYHR